MTASFRQVNLLMLSIYQGRCLRSVPIPSRSKTKPPAAVPLAGEALECSAMFTNNRVVVVGPFRSQCVHQLPGEICRGKTRTAQFPQCFRKCRDLLS
jgi:hypothetical protein